MAHPIYYEEWLKNGYNSPSMNKWVVDIDIYVQQQQQQNDGVVVTPCTYSK